MQASTEYVDVLPPGSFKAPSNTPLSLEALTELIWESCDDVLESCPELTEEEVTLIQTKLKTVVPAEINVCLGTLEKTDGQLMSLNQYPHYRREFNREIFAERNPDLFPILDGFCHVLRSKVALALYPEKIEELASFLKKESIKTWSPGMIKRPKDQSESDRKKIQALNLWLSKIRGTNGKTDWQLVHQKVSEIHPCEFTYNERRPPFTLETAIDAAQKILDQAIDQKGYWNPASDIDDNDASLYAFLTQQPQFRRDSLRPDLDYKRSSRPNWSAIAKALGPKYAETIKLGWWGAEHEYRNFQMAVDEFCDRIEESGLDEWRFSNNVTNEIAANAYRWLLKNCRTPEEKFDRVRMLEACNPSVRKKYVGSE